MLHRKYARSIIRCQGGSSAMHALSRACIRTLAQVSTVAVLGGHVGHGASDAARATLAVDVSLSSTHVHRRGGAGATDSAGRRLLLARRHNDATVRSGHNADRLVVHKTRVLVAVESGEVTRLAREHAAEALLLHKEAVRLADKKPLEILRRHTRGGRGQSGVANDAPGSFQNCICHVLSHVDVDCAPRPTPPAARPPTAVIMAGETASDTRGIPTAPFVVRALKLTEA